MPVRHHFVSPRADDPDPTLIQPSHWNAEHEVDEASEAVLGVVRLSADGGTSPDRAECEPNEEAAFASGDHAPYVAPLRVEHQ